MSNLRGTAPDAEPNPCVRVQPSGRADACERQIFFNLSPDLVAIVDADGTLSDVNPTGRRWLGWRDGPSAPIAWIDYVHPGEQERARQALANLFTTGEFLDLEVRIRWADERWHWTSWSGRAGADRRLAYLSARDITQPVAERKQVEAQHEALQERLLVDSARLTHAAMAIEATSQERDEAALGRREAEAYLARSRADLREAEAQLRQAQKMQAVGLLAGGIAHDFNNLLTVIQLAVALAPEELTPDNPLYEAIGDIKQCADKAAALTRQLLAFSRSQVLEPRLAHLGTISSDLTRILQRIVGTAVELSVESAADLGLVYVDQGQMEQVLMNLCLNARDAVPKLGQIRIRTTDRYLAVPLAAATGELPPGDYIELSVTDTGCGMDRETLARIFEPFFTTKPKDKGTGLGLSTVSGIVTQSGGGIEVESRPGQGTTFRVLLPRSEADDGGLVMAPTPPLPAANRGIGVLVVDDDDGVRNVLCALLRRAGFAVRDARCAGEALVMMERSPTPTPLLVTDVVMPLFSGRELAERVRRLQPDTRVLFVTGHPGEIEMHIDSDRCAVLPKPFDGPRLIQAIERLLAAQPAAA